MYIENRNLSGVQKFVDTKVVRRNSIGRNMVSANSITPYVNWMKFMTIYKKRLFWTHLFYNMIKHL